MLRGTNSHLPFLLLSENFHLHQETGRGRSVYTFKDLMVLQLFLGDRNISPKSLENFRSFIFGGESHDARICKGNQMLPFLLRSMCALLWSLEAGLITLPHSLLSSDQPCIALC